MRESGSVKLYWSLSRGSGVGGLGVAPSGLLSFSGRFLFSFSQFGFVFGLFRFVASLGASFQHLPGFGQTLQLVSATLYLIVHVHFLWQLPAIRRCRQRKQLLHFRLQERFQGPGDVCS